MMNPIMQTKNINVEHGRHISPTSPSFQPRRNGRFSDSSMESASRKRNDGLRRVTTATVPRCQGGNRYTTDSSATVSIIHRELMSTVLPPLRKKNIPR